jgi:hypothetical protein
MRLSIGTRSVLYGAHCFFLHPWFVAAAWWKLYGFPFDPRFWAAFFVHDLGYIGKPNMDGPEGERHVEFGAKIMTFLFDGRPRNGGRPVNGEPQDLSKWLILEDGSWIGSWGQFSLYHSRYYAKRNDHPVSRLCFADKMSFPLTPAWLYLPAVTATGEINEYLKNAQKADSGHWKPTGYDKRVWHRQLCEYMTKWVEEHKSGASDTWTDANRHAKTESGVWK